MRLSEVYKIAEELAPKRLSDELCEKYGFYDNSGILADIGEEITGIVFSLDLTEETIDRAIQEGANLIVTHHPVIYGAISSVEGKLARCIRRGISIISMHLNLDSAQGGIDESLTEGVALSAGGKATDIALQYALDGGGYGRGYDIEEISVKTLAAKLQETFRTERILVYGGERKVKRVASFCGAGADEKSLAFALQTGANLLISSDIKHHILSAALERGLSVIVLTHYASEQYGFKKYYEKIKGKIALPCIYCEETELF